MGGIYEKIFNRYTREAKSTIDIWEKGDIIKTWIKRNAPPRALSPSKNREFFLFVGKTGRRKVFSYGIR